MDIQRFKRGQIWWMKDNSPQYDEHLQGGTRPVIIISNDSANRFSSNLTVIPCTSQEKKELPTHVPLEINGPSTALVENIKTISNNIITNYIGTCDNNIMLKIDNAIKVALGLVTLKEDDFYHNKELESPSNFNVIEISHNGIKKSVEINPLVLDTKTGKIEVKEPKKSKRGRKPGIYKYTQEFMYKYIDEYKNIGKEEMAKKYKESSLRAVTDKVYRFRKELGITLENDRSKRSVKTNR